MTTFATFTLSLVCVLQIAVPVNAGSKDHLTEMLMPVDTWGKTFMTTSTPDRSIGDVFRIVASEDSTTVTFSKGTTKTISKAGEFKVSEEVREGVREGVKE